MTNVSCPAINDSITFSCVSLNLSKPKYSCSALCRSNRFFPLEDGFSLADFVANFFTTSPPVLFTVVVPISQIFHRISPGRSHLGLPGRLAHICYFLSYPFLSDHNAISVPFFAQAAPEMSYFPFK